MNSVRIIYAVLLAFCLLSTHAQAAVVNYDIPMTVSEVYDLPDGSVPIGASAKLSVSYDSGAVGVPSGGCRDYQAISLTLMAGAFEQTFAPGLVRVCDAMM